MKKLLSRLSVVSTTASLAFLSAVSPVLAQSNIDVTVPKGYALDLGRLISFVLRVVMVIAALLVFGYLIWGGVEWITSGGEKSKTESARNKITAAIIGLIILAASFAILQLALSFLGFSGIEEVLNSTNNINQ